MLNLQNINVILGKGTKLQRPILQNLNLQVKPHEFMMLIGSNGAGKSTILNVIAGSLKPDSGTIILDGKDITFQKLRSKDIAFVMQDPRMGTMENLSIFENLSFALNRGRSRSLLPFSKRFRIELFTEKLSLLEMGLENRLDEIVINLSGGQRQALSLIMAILTEAKILLLDEITAALDPDSAKNIMALTNKLIREEKRTAIMITHNMIEANQYGDSLMILKDGQIYCS
jgi:putative tryptophan/tyrosine transport system ATP-binding protein